MRLAGTMDAAGLDALEHYVDRLAEDHANAARLGALLAGIEGLTVELSRPTWCSCGCHKSAVPRLRLTCKRKG